MKEENEQRDLIRQKLWVHVWEATASADNYKNPSTPTLWADAALHAFDERFPQPNKE